MDASTLLAGAQLALERAPASPPTKVASPDKARETAEELEAMFLAQMIGHMFEGIETDGPFGGGHGEEMFRSMLFDEFGKAIARAGGIGIADAVQREILRVQEVK
jgi:Rod binding domain-containing protein